jgi:hypothetical protein
MSETPTSETPMFKPVSTKRAPRKAVAAKVAGIVGVVICVVIIVVVWFGLGTVSQTVDDLGNDVNAGFGRAITASDTVANGLNEAVTSLESMRAEAAELVAGRPDPERFTGLQARLGQLTDRYRDLRIKYVEARESVVGLTTTLGHVGRLIPGSRAPEGAGDTLVAVDAKLQAIDNALVSTWTSLSEAQPGAAAAEALANAGTPLQDAISGAATAVDGLTANLQRIQANADATVDSIRTILLVAAIALSVLFVWVLALNIALWLLGRAWERDTA